MKNRIFLLNKNIETGIKAEENEQKIIIFPRGDFFVEKYDTKLTFDDKFFQNIIDNFNNPALSKPFIDKNHEFQESFGDIIGFEIAETGLIGTIKLNKKGTELIKEREYKYISPAFFPMSDSEGNQYKNVLVAVSLTNVPALNGSLPQLQDQIKLSRDAEFVLLEASIEPWQWDIMREILQTMRDYLIEREGMEKADDIIPLWKINSMQITENDSRYFQKKFNIGGNKMGLLQRHLGLNESANEDSVLERVKSIELERDKFKADNAALLERTQKAEATATEIGTKFNAMQLEARKKDAEEVVKKGIADGKYPPVLLEMKIAQYLENPEIVKKELEMIPANPGGQKTTSTPDSKGSLDDIDRKIMLDRGMNPDKPEDVQKYQSYNPKDEGGK